MSNPFKVSSKVFLLCSLFPGLQIRELEQVVDHRDLAKDDADSQRDSQRHRRHKTRTGHKLKMLHSGGNQQSESGKKVTVVGRPESLSTQQSSDGSVSSLSLATNSTNSSNSETRSAASGSTASTASSAFLGPNGKVAPEVLKQIAGFNKGKLSISYFSYPELRVPVNARFLFIGPIFLLLFSIILT